MAKIDVEYRDLVRKIFDNGRTYEDPKRKGVIRLQIPKYDFEHDLRDGFPAITTKKLYFDSVVGELLWFLRGGTNVKDLWKDNIHIWDKDGYKFSFREGYNREITDWIEQVQLKNFSGDLGRVYGAQFRDWLSVGGDTGLGGVYRIHTDQIDNLIKGLKEEPLSTEHIVTAWNPAEKKKMALPPCHFMFQVMVYPLTYKERYTAWFNSNYETGMEYHWDEANPIDFENAYYKPTPMYGFDLVWSQRSCDVFLGIPFNIASYALLAHIIGFMVNMIPRKIYGDFRNVHLYNNSWDAVTSQVARDPNKYYNCGLTISETALMVLSGDKSLDEKLSFLSIDDFKLSGYDSYPPLKVEMLERD